MKNVFHRIFRIAAPGELHDDPGSILRWGLFTILVFIVGGLFWMGLAPLDGAVVAQGLVRVNTERVPVVHGKGGVISAVHTRDGDHVKPGQVLVELTDPGRLSTFESASYLYDGELARNARLRSEQAMSDGVHFPPLLLARAKERGVRMAIDQELKVFRNRRDARQGVEAGLRKEKRLIESEGAQLSSRAETQREAVGISSEQVRGNEDLAKRGYVSSHRLLDIKRLHVGDRVSLGELEADQLRAQQRVADIELKIAESTNRFLEQVALELKSSDERLFQLQQQVAALRSEVQRDAITSPVEGVVINQRPLAVGAMVVALQPVLEVVPSSGTEYVEALVMQQDIRHLKIGGEAEIQIQGWNRRTMPLLKGAVDYISADATRQGDSIAYIVRVRISGAVGPGDVEPLRAGMAATTYIKSGARTLLDYLLEPLVDSMRSAFRENI